MGLNMKKLLISGLGGSLFPYLSEQLAKKFELFFVDANPSIQKIYRKYNLYTSPLVTDENYSSFVKNIVSENEIDYYIPLIDEELGLAKHEIEGISGIKVISPTKKFIDLSLNKFELMNTLKREELSTIISYLGDNFESQISPPLLLKPIYGRGSRGVQVINSERQIQAYYLLEGRSPSDTLIQPLIEGDEYTVGVTVNNLNDIIAISSKKVINKKGITQMAVTENNEQINALSKRIVNELKPCGPINIQLFITPDKEIKIFEINPRFSTTTVMEYQGGLDLIDLYIRYHNKKYTDDILMPKSGIILFRRWENIFL